MSKAVLILLHCACLLFACAAAAQTTEDATLREGRELVASLKLDQASDAAVFERIGMERAGTLLNAVMNRGLAAGATPNEWTEMHRAIAGLIELSVARGELFRAAVYANFQDVYYRNYEADYNAALAAARQQLDLQQRSKQTATLYIAWKNIGENLIRLGRVDEGVDALYQSQRLVDDPTSTVAAIVRREIIDAEIARGHGDAARREVASFVQAATPAAPALFRGRTALAQSRLEVEDGQYDQALASMHAATKAMAGDKAAADFALEVLNDLMSMVLLTMNVVPFEQALGIAQRIDREFPDLPISMSAQAHLAIDYRRRLAGQFDVLLREDLAGLESARSTSNVGEQIGYLRSLAATYAFANDKRQALALLEQALALEKSLLPPSGIPDNAASQYSYLRLLASLGAGYADVGDAARARAMFAEITRTYDAIPDATSKARATRLYGEAELGHALVDELEHRIDAARKRLDAALTSANASARMFTRSAVLLQRARLERTANDQPAEAVRYYEAAIQAFHAEKDLRSELSTRLQLARYLAVEAAQRIPDALRRATEHLKLVEAAASAIEFAEAQWRVRFLQGIVAEGEGRTQDAISLYTEAVTRLDQLRAGLSQQEQRQAFMDNVSIQELYQRLIGLLTTSGRKADAWDFLERGKARSFLEILQGRRFRPDSEARMSEDLRALEKQVIDLRAQIGNELAGSGKERDVLRAQLVRAQERFVLAREQASLRGERAGHELALRPLTIEALQAKLAPGTTLIEYALLEGRITAFVITRDKFVQATWRADIDALRRQTESVRQALREPDAAEEVRPLLRRLSAQLVQPIITLVPAQTDTLLLIPADFLNYLPFQALPLADGRDLLDRFALAYLPSASALAFLDAGQHAQGKLFLGALGNVAVDGLPGLPGTLNEVKGIATTYARPEIAVEKAFTYERLRRALLEDTVVHVATHGLLNKDSPLFNALITSPAPRQPPRLSLYELTDMKLKARLVVLSACDTGIGELRKGDEITSLTRVFLQAGADTVVASLWSVSDRATALLMKDFYRRIQRGRSPAHALREAALEVRKQFPQPFYWAPFIVTGAR